MTARVPAEERVYALLAADVALAGVVGARIYHEVAPQGSALPRLVYWRVSGDHLADLDGETGTEQVRLQVDCQAASGKMARAVAGLVLDAMGAATSFQSTPDGDQIGYESDPDIHTVSLDFQITNHER